MCVGVIEFDVTALLQDEAAGSPVLIKSIVPGGSCDRDGVCRVGDTVIAVNDEKVAHLAVIDVFASSGYIIRVRARHQGTYAGGMA